MTPLWFWELPSGWVFDGSDWHHWLWTEVKVYFDNYQVGGALNEETK